MSRKQLNIGLFGFGTVAGGLYQALEITHDLGIHIRKIVVKNREKPRTIPASRFSYDPDDILLDPEINVVVELIDDADAAFVIVKKALSMGKAVVTANKKLVAEHLTELMQLQQLHEVPLLYEAACCASIPVVRNLEEYYDHDLLRSIQGIVNGSTNYILSAMYDHNQSFADALKAAQEKGFAESDPRLDVEGFDAKYKLVLLLLHAFGIVTRPEEIWNIGIQHIEKTDARYAREKGLKIKLLAQARKINNRLITFVAPQFVSSQNKLYFTNEEYNGLLVESFFADKQFLEGKGAGAFPTASAVLSDLSALRYDYRYEYKKTRNRPNIKIEDRVPVKVYVRYSDSENPFKDFIRVEEQFMSKGNHYLIGIIRLDKLRKADWLDRCSVIFTEDAFEPIENPPFHDAIWSGLPLERNPDEAFRDEALTWSNTKEV